MKQPTHEVVLAGPADRDFIEIMEWSTEHFGVAASDRYETLIGQALIDLQEDPFRAGTRRRPELATGIYTYHLTFSRERVSGERVKAPRHFLLYRLVGSRIEVLRIVHDSRDLARHLPERMP